MIIDDIAKNIIELYHIDDALKIYPFEDHIDFVEYTEGYDIESNELVTDFNGKLFTIYIDSTKIIAVENQCISILTPSNKKIIFYLMELLGKHIIDFPDTKKIQDDNKEDYYILYKN